MRQGCFFLCVCDEVIICYKSYFQQGGTVYFYNFTNESVIYSQQMHELLQCYVIMNVKVSSYGNKCYYEEKNQR